jgi:hypothetical protein
VPLPFVSIDVSGPTVGDPRAQYALVQACDEAFSAGRCGLATEAVPAGSAVRHARVRWLDEDQLRVRVELAEHGQAQRRELEFRTTDSPIERWRAVGLVVGTIADESTARSMTAAPPAPAVSTPTPEPSPRAVPTPLAPPDAWLDATFIGGPALGSSWRFGGSLRTSHRVYGPVFALGSVRYAERPTDARNLQLRWFWPSIGAGGTWRPAMDFDLQARLELLAELAEATATDGRGRQDSSKRWAAGARIGADAGWRLLEWGELVVGGDVSYTGHPIEVRVGNDSVGSVPSTSVTVGAGFRFLLR